MEKFNDRVYHLLIIGRNDLIQQFMFSFVVCGCYLIYAVLVALVFKSGYSELVASILVSAVVGSVFWFFDKYRLVTSVAVKTREVEKEPERVREPEIQKTEDILFADSATDDLEYFSFNDRVQDTFERNDPVELANLLANSNESKIEEVLKR